jgi:hypothetical protein
MTNHFSLFSAVCVILTGLTVTAEPVISTTLATKALPSFYEGKDLVKADTAKIVRIELNDSEFLELELPQLAYQNNRETKIQETDIERLSAIFVSLTEITQLPVGEQIQPFQVKKRADTLKKLDALTQELKSRIDVYEVTRAPDPTVTD